MREGLKDKYRTLLKKGVGSKNHISIHWNFSCEILQIGCCKSLLVLKSRWTDLIDRLLTREVTGRADSSRIKFILLARLVSTNNFIISYQMFDLTKNNRMTLKAKIGSRMAATHKSLFLPRRSFVAIVLFTSSWPRGGAKKIPTGG